MHRSDPDQQRLGELFRELEFSRLAEQLAAFDRENAREGAARRRCRRRRPRPAALPVPAPAPLDPAEIILD